MAAKAFLLIQNKVIQIFGRRSNRIGNISRLITVLVPAKKLLDSFQLIHIRLSPVQQVIQKHLHVRGQFHRLPINLSDFIAICHQLFIGILRKLFFTRLG